MGDFLLQSLYNRIKMIIENFFFFFILGFEAYSDIPGFAAYFNDEFAYEEISKLYNLILHLDQKNNHNVLKNIFDELSEMQSKI